ncbi:hypothetical protein EV121DRAFT_281379 [Schizophyllum commune]
MNSSFTFPPRAPPTMRPETTPPGNAGQQQSASNDAPSRDSNLVRASILDAALDLGYGSNSTVAKWMFENPLEEEDEESMKSPVTINSPISEDSAAASATTTRTTPPTSLSDHHYAMFPRSADTFHPRPMAQDPPRLPSMVESESTPSTVTFAPSAPPKKLRKKARGDGYESDGGYVSEAGRRRKASTKSSDKKEAREAKKEEREAKKEERKKKAAPKADDSGYYTGYETDRASTATRKSGKSLKSKKSKTKLAEAGYETDDGYISAGGSLKPKKSRFFRLGKSKEAPPPTPEPHVRAPEPVRPAMPLPIAQRFATTLQPSESSKEDVGDTSSLQASSVSQTTAESSRGGTSIASTITSAHTSNEGSAHISRSTEESNSREEAPQMSPVSSKTEGQDIPYRPGSPTGESTNGPSSPVSYKLGSPSKRRHSLSKRSSLDFITRPLSRMSARRLSNASPPPSGAANYPAISYPLGRSPSPPPSSSTRPIYPPQFLDLDEDSPTRSPQEGRGFFKARATPSPAPAPYTDTQSPDTRSPNTLDQAIPNRLAPATKHDVPRQTQTAFLKDERHRPDRIVIGHPGAAVLGRYDLPPPSPPPQAPLPSIPPRSPLRQADRDRSPLPDSGRPSPGLTRAASDMDSRFGLPRSPRFPPRSASDNDYGFGRDVSPGRLSPLPPRDQNAYMPSPTLTPQGRESPLPRGRVSPFPPQPVRPDIKPRLPIQIPRSREQEFAAGAWGAHSQPPADVPADSDSEDEWEHDSRYTEEDSSEGPVVRFELASDRHLSHISEGPSASDVHDYYFNGRESRYTESVYSRASTLLDTERSGEARSRLLGRVEALYDSAGRERSAVPPVPKIPDALLRAPTGGLAPSTSMPDVRNGTPTRTGVLARVGALEARAAAGGRF